MEDDQAEQEAQSVVNFIPCLSFVRRGVAKEQPEKVNLTKEELAKIIKDTKKELEYVNWKKNFFPNV